MEPSYSDKRRAITYQIDKVERAYRDCMRGGDIEAYIVARLELESMIDALDGTDHGTGNPFSTFFLALN